MKKYIAELFGTMVLVLFGCGSAAVAGATLGTLGIAFAFGLSIVATAYAIGHISGCHINPAVSLAMLIRKKMTAKDFVGYVVAQVIGAILGSAILMFIISSSSVLDIAKAGLGQNGFGANLAVGLSMGGAFVVEVILTFVFIMAVIGATSNIKTANIAGIVIGLTLTLVHIMGIPLTGTSVNPARSLAPALLLGGEPLSQVWVFILAPLVGAALAAFFWKALNGDEDIA